MPDRLRALLDHPLDPSAARARRHPVRGPRRLQPPQPAGTRSERPEVRHRGQQRRQDPQDRDGSPAARRAASALRGHRALQHVPYRRGRLTVSLVGARRGRAVLRVTAPRIGAARRGWLAFLDRFHDAGRAYVFRLRGGRGGDG